MFARVHTSTEVKGNNLGSCHRLAKYLDKEAEQENVSGKTIEDRETSSRLVHYLDKEEGNNFFSSRPGVYDMGEVITDIDSNVKHLCKDDTKFYMLTLNPSVSEQKHLIGKDIEDFHSLSKEEQDKVKSKLVDFTREAMNDYARNFGRDNIKAGDDLLYYARIETQRTYKKDCEEVKKGQVKAGSLKPGLNLHVHIIVSRNSRDQKTKLSPLVKSKGNNWKLNNTTVRRGFNHEQWKVDVQSTFNRKFSYNSLAEETYLSNAVWNNEKKPSEAQIEIITNKVHYSGTPAQTVNRTDFNQQTEKDAKNKGKFKKESGKSTYKSIALKGADTNSIPGMNKIKQKAKEEVLQENFKTERMLIGQTEMIMRTLKNPVSSMKQAIISEIKNMLNPTKEL